MVAAAAATERTTTAVPSSAETLCRRDTSDGGSGYANGRVPKLNSSCWSKLADAAGNQPHIRAGGAAAWVFADPDAVEAVGCPAAGCGVGCDAGAVVEALGESSRTSITVPVTTEPPVAASACCSALLGSPSSATVALTAALGA